MNDAAQADLLVHRLASDWRQAKLSPADRGLCEFAEKLTRSPAEMTEQDVSSLREAGHSDQAIHDASQIISYFNYINRIADSLSVDLEEGLHAWESSVPQR